jgi:adenine-specific DNA-methyltransferase
MDSLLIYGDNLSGLNHLIELGFAEKVDLVYIDPPFASNNIFYINSDRVSTMSSSSDGVIAYSDKFNLTDYLAFLRKRLELLHALLSPEGSIYLHIDYKVGHYVKVLMDEIFGFDNFVNDISRIKCNPKNFSKKGYGNIKDCILFYTKTKNYIWNEVKESYTDENKTKLFPKIDKDGRRYTTIPLHAPGESKSGKTSLPFKGIDPPKGRHWRTDVDTLNLWDEQGLIEYSSTGNPRKKLYLDEQDGKKRQDIWDFKDPTRPLYPTEKNHDMLDVIIKTSSNENSIVLDCFCGSGSTLLRAAENKRRWIGIDQSESAIKVTRKRMNQEFHIHDFTTIY